MDRPIHLASLSITKQAPHTEASVMLPIWVTQSTLDGMLELIKYLEGLQSGANIGTVPGAIDLVMFYRTIREAIYRAEADVQEAARASEIPEGEPTDYNPAYVGNGVSRDRFGRRVMTIEEWKARNAAGGC